MPERPGDVTQLLNRLSNGERQLEGELIAMVYDELHRLAEGYMRHERRDHSLQPTALVNEAYVRLVGDRPCSWKDRAHFFATAAKAMRHILVDYARRREANKRGGQMTRVDLDEAPLFTEERFPEVLAIEEALGRLDNIDPRQSQIVELRFFAGFSVNEVADLLQISRRTVLREWELARRWLYSEMNAMDEDASPTVGEN